MHLPGNAWVSGAHCPKPKAQAQRPQQKQHQAKLTQFFSLAESDDHSPIEEPDAQPGTDNSPIENPDDPPVTERASSSSRGPSGPPGIPVTEALLIEGAKLAEADRVSKRARLEAIAEDISGDDSVDARPSYDSDDDAIMDAGDVIEAELRQLPQEVWQRTLEWLRDKPDLSDDAPMFDRLLNRLRFRAASHHMGDISMFLDSQPSTDDLIR